MTHRRSDARSDGVELELAALRGRVAMVEPNWWRHGQRATSSPLSSSGSGWTTSGCGPASMSWPPRSSSCDGRPSGRLPVLQGHHGGPPPTGGPQGGRGLRPPRTPPGPRPRPGQPGHRRWAAWGLPALWRRAHRRAGGLPVSRRPPPAAGDRDLPLRHPDWPLPAVPATCQPRHPEQTSQALVRPASRSARVRSRWRRGRPRGSRLPAGKVARLLGQLGIKITPGGVTQALARAARHLQPTYAALVGGVQASRSSPRTRPAGASAAGAPGCGHSPGTA
jgi:hypothetical protein